MIDIISGLKYCRIRIVSLFVVHLHKVVHRDIKPENLLVTNDNHVKISFWFLFERDFCIWNSLVLVICYFIQFVP